MTEQATHDAYMTIFDELGMAGRMVSGSKSHYDSQHPGHVVVYNANIIVEGLGKVWFGDVDLTTDAERLQRIADKVGKVYVLKERDGRFQNEDKPLIENAVRVFEPAPSRKELKADG